MHAISFRPPARSVLLAVMVFPSLAAAELTHSGYVEAGVEYRSNPVVTELDAAASESDSAAVLRAGLSSLWHSGGDWSLYGAYDLDTRRHRTLQPFDLTLHLGQLGVRYDLEATALGLEHQQALAALDGAWFFAQGQTTAYVERVLGTDSVLRAGLSTGQQEYDHLPDRDASLKGARVDLYWSPAQPDLLALSLAVDRINSHSSAYRYRAGTVGLRYQRDFSALGLRHEAGLGWRYQRRDYEQIESASADVVDARQQWQASLETELNDHFALAVAAERGHVSLASGSRGYRDDRVSLTLKAAF